MEENMNSVEDVNVNVNDDAFNEKLGVVFCVGVSLGMATYMFMDKIVVPGVINGTKMLINRFKKEEDSVKVVDISEKEVSEVGNEND